MTRLAFLTSLFLLASSIPAIAQPPAQDVSAVLRLQRAIAAGREHLRAGRSVEAVAVLEGELLNADGNTQFLNLLRDAYTARLRDLQGRKADAATIESVQRSLMVLDGKGSAGELGPAPPATPVLTIAAQVRAPAPPIPDAPTDLVPPPPPTEATALVAPPALPASPNAATDDPFQQKVRDRAVPSGDLSRASEAFAARRYAQAAALFAQAARANEPLTAGQRDEWAYSRLHGVALRLNQGSNPPADLAREIEDALAAGSDRVAPFGKQLLAEIRRRNPATGSATVAADWQVIETASFRVLHQSQPGPAAEVGQTAEAARKDMYERWAGAAAAAWSPRCDVYLHATSADYAKTTGKPADQPGHSTVGIQSGKVVSRRIDLRLDGTAVLDGTLPSEVTQVVLADLFADQPLPRWAVVGMAALSESPEGVARYQRAVPTLLRDKKLFAVGPFLDRAAFPDPTAVTAFYAESVSLVSYLVELKGSKAFTTFLREAPRRGYGRALASHYGFKDPADLQEKWVGHVLGGE
jgi:hypothetical protein